METSTTVRFLLPELTNTKVPYILPIWRYLLPFRVLKEMTEIFSRCPHEKSIVNRLTRSSDVTDVTVFSSLSKTLVKKTSKSTYLKKTLHTPFDPIWRQRFLLSKHASQNFLIVNTTCRTITFSHHRQKETLSIQLKTKRTIKREPHHA